MQRLWKKATRAGVILAALIVLVPLAKAFGEDAQLPFKLDLRLVDAAATQTQPSASGNVLALSVKDAITIALKNNLDITIEGYNPQLRMQGHHLPEGDLRSERILGIRLYGQPISDGVLTPSHVLYRLGELLELQRGHAADAAYRRHV